MPIEDANEISVKVRSRIDRAVVLQDLDQRACGAILELVDRVLRADPSKASDVEKIRSIALEQSRERPGHDFDATLPWISLAQLLP
jgi:hypothetical protein